MNSTASPATGPVGNGFVGDADLAASFPFALSGGVAFWVSLGLAFCAAAGLASVFALSFSVDLVPSFGLAFSASPLGLSAATAPNVNNASVTKRSNILVLMRAPP